jgi:hypothetical protein
MTSRNVRDGVKVFSYKLLNPTAIQFLKVSRITSATYIQYLSRPITTFFAAQIEVSVINSVYSRPVEQGELADGNATKIRIFWAKCLGFLTEERRPRFPS